MSKALARDRNHFHAMETAREHLLAGTLLASFWQRLLGYFVDLLIAVVLWFPVEWSWKFYVLHQRDIHMTWDFHEAGNVVVMLLYWGFGNYFGNGRTPGKWVARTRIVSLTSERMGCGSRLSGRWVMARRCWKAAWGLYSFSGRTTGCARKTGWLKRLLWTRGSTRPRPIRNKNLKEVPAGTAYLRRKRATISP